MAVVGILKQLTSRSTLLMRELRKLYTLIDFHDISLRPVYIRSEDNSYADALSRMPLQEDWKLNPAWFRWCDLRWGPHTTDRFASFNNRQVLRYNSEFLDPQSAGVDAFAQALADWLQHNNWANPPWSLLAQLVHFLQVTGAACTVVAPFWRGAPWFRELMSITREFVVLDPAPNLFLPGHLGSVLHLGNPHWRVVLCRVPRRSPMTFV